MEKIEISESLMTKKDVCNYLKCSIGKIDGLIKSGKISYLKLGRNVKFRKKDIETFLDYCKTVH